MRLSIKRMVAYAATKSTDKEYDRYKGLGAPYARASHFTKDFDDS